MARIPDQVEKSKEILMKSAIDVFGEKGYDKAKIADIVAKAGFSQRTFYIYFKNKESIYWQILNDWKTKLMQIFCIEKDNKDYQLAIQRKWEKIFEFMDENAGQTKVVYHLNPYIGEIRKDLLAKLKEIMTYEKEVKNIRADIDINFLSTSVLSIMEALTMQYLIENKRNVEFLSKQLAAFFAKGASDVNQERDLHE